MGVIIKCCQHCVPPKRYPGCHDSCPDYAAQKAEHERLKAADAEKRKTNNNIYSQRADNITKTLKRHGRH